MDDEFTVCCPKCGHEQQDLDGFGVLYCDPKAGGCGFCRHPMLTDGVCGCCGQRPTSHPAMEIRPPIEQPTKERPCTS